MAIAPLQIPSSNINNLVDQSQWSSLANLGNVYRQAREDAAKRDALANLGQGVDADTATLLHSGVPSLASIGLNMQQSALNRAREDARYAVTDKRAAAELAIQQAAARRAQETYEKQDADEAAAAKLIAGLTGRQPAPPAAPPSPFPAAGAPPLVASPPVAQPAVAAPPVAPPMQQAVPLAPGQLPPDQPAVPLAPQAPVAPSPIDPSQLAATTAAAPPSVVDRISSNLTSGQPAAAAGISRDQLAELYRNPITRPIATAFLQKQFSPDPWKYEKTEDGRIIGINERTQETKDLTPPTASGQPAPTKEERETQGYYQAGIKLGMNDTQAKAFAANKGKLPSENLSVHAQKAIDDNDNVYTSANTAIDNIKRLQDLSPKAFQGFGASALGSVTGQFGEGAGTATTEYNNIALRNVIAMVKSAFPRPTEYETKLMQRIETGADMPRNVRDDLLVDLRKQLQLRADQAQAKSDAIRAGTYYKPGGGEPAATPAPTTAPSDDLAAAKWARDNPNDPRAQQIMQHLRGR
jgi:hypothetical protein